MPHEELDFEQLTKTLAENFNILADEVQFLSDRRTILEHKLRFAHEQVGRHLLRALSLLVPGIVMRNLALDLELLLAATTDLSTIS